MAGRLLDNTSSIARDSPPGLKYNNFGTVNIAGTAALHVGDLHKYEFPTLFGGLQALTSDAIDDAAINYRRSRASIQVSEEINDRTNALTAS